MNLQNKNAKPRNPSQQAATASRTFNSQRPGLWARGVAAQKTKPGKTNLGEGLQHVGLLMGFQGSNLSSRNVVCASKALHFKDVNPQSQIRNPPHLRSTDGRLATNHAYFFFFCGGGGGWIFRKGGGTLSFTFWNP